MTDITLEPVTKSPTTWQRFMAHRLALAGLITISIIALLSMLAPWVSPVDPNHIEVARRYIFPFSEGAALGTDDMGRDVFSRLLAGGRVSLSIGISAMAVAVVLGFLIGGVAAYVGGVVDPLLMRLTDMMLCFPNIFLLLFAAAFFSPSLPMLALMIGLTSWMEVARIAYAEVRSLKQRDFIEAARLAGASPFRIIIKQILPNMVAPLLVAATLNTARAILLESYVSFLGYGIQPPQASWGNMLTYAQSDFAIDPWLTVFPGLAIALSVGSLNFIGEGLRDALDVRSRGR